MPSVRVLLLAVLLAVLGVCHVTSRSLPYTERLKRISSDQRMAELQALLSMSYRPSSSVGHGTVDTYNAGKRKRSSYSDLSGSQQLWDTLRRMDAYMEDPDSL